MLSNKEKSMEKIVTLCKNRGFVYAGSEIYGTGHPAEYPPCGYLYTLQLPAVSHHTV